MKPSPKNKASAARESRKANAKRRDIDLAHALAARLGRTPTRAECVRAGIWCGPRNLWPTHKAFIAATGLEHRAHGVRVTPSPPSQRKVYRMPGAKRRREEMAVAREHGHRRCDACLQKTGWSSTCQHCGAAWNRTRAA